MQRQLMCCVALALGAAACDSGGSDDFHACTAIYAYGLSVQVQDSVTGSALSEGVTVTAQDGNYLETLQPFPSGGFVGAGERAGTYTIRVGKTGYATWERTGVVVTKDECHVIGVSVLAKLQHN